MFAYTIRRVLIMIPTIMVISAIVFTIIQLPPGDYLTSYIAELQSQGESVDSAKIEFLRGQYGFDRPMIEQYALWVLGLLRGDLGYSFEYSLPVVEVVGDRVYLTILVAFTTILFTWIVSFPIGIYSATRQYSWGDYSLT
ncbi:MAG: ABC transporter permease, partial [Alphaproteobacteria bacterium]